MKKLIPIFPVIFISMAANAQITWGVKAGTGISNIAVFNADNSPGYQAKLTYLGGIYVNRKFTSHTGMTGELIYTNKGGKANPSVHLHYINVPVLFNYYFADGRLRFEGGPELGYLISARTKYGSVDDFWSNVFDLSVDFGIAYNFTKFTLGTRTNYGLFDVASMEKRDINNQPAGEMNFRNRSVQFYLGYCISCN
jgi:hypothetical protein